MEGRGENNPDGLIGNLDNEVYGKENTIERTDDKNLMSRLDRIQNRNEQLLEEANADNRALFDKGRTTDLRQKNRIKQLEEKQKEMPIIKKKLGSFDPTKRKNTNRNKVISILRIGYAIAKFKANMKFANNAVKLDALRFFINNNKKATTTLEEWVASCTKVAVNSVLQYETLEIDMSNFPPSSTPPQEVKDCFVRLQTRIKGLLEPMGLNLNNNPIDITTMTWMRIPITNNYIVPYGFYYNFVLSRLNLKQGEIVSLDKRHHFLVISFFMIINILVKKILLEQMNQTKNSNIRKNFKMLASVFYHSLIKFFKEKMKAANNVGNNYTDKIKNQCKEPPEMDINFNKDSSAFYRKALKDYYTKLESVDFGIKSEARQLLEKLGNSFHNTIKDTNPNEVWEIVNLVYTENQMKSFFKLSEINNFKVAEAIINWTNKFIEKIYSTEG